MNRIDYLKSLGFVDVTEQIKSEIRANAKITKAMEYVLKQIDKYELKFVVNPEYIGEKKTSFTVQLPERIQKFEKIHLDTYTILCLKIDFGYSIEKILEGWEFFLTGNPELPHFTTHNPYDNYDYERYPQKYREEFRNCEY
jgi:hypothetical protein